MQLNRVFLLSPANCGGLRARMLVSPRAQFDLARRLGEAPGAPLGEVFSFMSGLYFRGKLAYAKAFASPPQGCEGVLVITPNEGLRPADELVTRERILRFASIAFEMDSPAYRRPLLRDAQSLARSAGDGCEIVLLGSVATGKYIDVLKEAVGPALRFPAEFAGRGDMSRGGLMLRCVASRTELTYVPIDGAPRRGSRPARLEPLPRTPGARVDP